MENKLSFDEVELNYILMVETETTTVIRSA